MQSGEIFLTLECSLLKMRNGEPMFWGAYCDDRIGLRHAFWLD